MIKKLAAIIITILVYACATVQSPTGGEKDAKAPVLYESVPKDQSTNFDGKEIKLFFNEWMQLEQLNKELIITPREDIKYEATLKKQELIIKLKEPLKDSTTYTFNFRKALSDITEGNLWNNPTIAFSTGEYLDSLQVSGTITKLMTQEPAKNFLVGLYDYHTDTANLRQGKPVYFTTTDAEGNYQMNNLKAGKYLLFTFNDANNNLINDSQSEPFGFYQNPIDLIDSLSPINLSTYKRNEDSLKLKKFSPVGKDFIVQYNKGLSHYKIFNPNDSSQFIYANNVEQSQYLKIYKENFPDLQFETDSVALYIQVQDSINQTRLDTVHFRIRESRITNEEIKIVSKPQSNIISGQQQFTYNFNKPVQQINYDSIQLRIDSIPITTFDKNQINLSFNKKSVQLKLVIDKKQITSIVDSIKYRTDSITQVADSLNNQTQQERPTTGKPVKSQRGNRSNKEEGNLQMTNSRRQNIEEQPSNNSPSPNSNQNNTQYNLHLYTGQGAFIGIELDSTSSSSTTLKFMNQEDYGLIKGSISNVKSNFILELLTEKYEPTDTIINKKEYQFNYVKPGSYRLRIIEDTNGNNKWDAGNPLTLEPAENIYYLDEVITVKANWEILDKNFNLAVDKGVDSGGKK